MISNEGNRDRFAACPVVQALMMKMMVDNPPLLVNHLISLRGWGLVTLSTKTKTTLTLAITALICHCKRRRYLRWKLLPYLQCPLMNSVDHCQLDQPRAKTR